MGLFDLFRSSPGENRLSERTPLELEGPPQQTPPVGADDRTLAGVVATAPRWHRGFDVLESMLPDVDDALAEEGPDVYMRMEADPEISACLFQIDRRVLGRDLEWTPPPGLEGDPFAVEVANYVQRVVRSEVDLRADLQHLFRHKTRRLAVSQVVWRQGDGRYGEPAGTWVPDRLIAEDRRHFGRHRSGTLYLNSTTVPRALTPPLGEIDRKFIVSVYDPEPSRPEGKSLLDGIYWSWKLLRAGGGLWLDLLDRFGVPSIIALFDAVADVGDPNAVAMAQALADQIAGQLSAVQSGSSVALAAKDAKTVDTSGRGQDFDLFLRFLEKRMRKGLLGTTLTVDVSDVGARAQGEVSEREVDGVAMWHGAGLARTIERTLGRWTARFRYGDRAAAVFPKARFDWRSTATFEEYCKAAQSGIPVSQAAAYTVYNVPKPAGDEDSFVAVRATSTLPADDSEVVFSDAPFGSLRTTHRRTTMPTS